MQFFVLAMTFLAPASLAAQETQPDTSQPASGTAETAQSPAAPEPASDQPASPPSFSSPASHPKFIINGDATIKYTGAFRVRGQSATLIDPNVNPSNVNQDDGDRAFNKGKMINDRGDILSEIDVIDVFVIRHGDCLVETDQYLD
jgi:hypothetical protein